MKSDVRGVGSAPRARGAIALGASALLAVTLASPFLDRTPAPPTDQAGATVVEASVAVECDGWADANVPLGAFASGRSADGAMVDEHLTFRGPGAQAVDLPAGSFEVVPQLPRIMLADGTVLASNGPVMCLLSKGDGAAATLSYAPVSTVGLSDDDLEAVARTSFEDGDEASLALDRARARRDAALAEARGDAISDAVELDGPDGSATRGR